jgi:hypothetical protein
MSMAERITSTLSSLTDEDLVFWPAWRVTTVTDEGDQILAPAPMNSYGEILKTVDQVWCRSVCRLSNGVELPALSLCIGKSNEGPINWSITVDSEELRLILPPAPDFVLREEGPEAFARKLSMDLSDVFPLTLEVLVKFEAMPRHRSIKIGANGERQELFSR